MIKPAKRIRLKAPRVGEPGDGIRKNHLDGYNQVDANHETRELLPYATRP